MPVPSATRTTEAPATPIAGPAPQTPAQTRRLLPAHPDLRAPEPTRPAQDTTQPPRRPPRPYLSELRLSAFGAHRGTRVELAPCTVLAGPSGSGKTTVLRAYEALARLAGGAELEEAFPAPAGCVPQGARPDAGGRRGFRIGCTADGPEGPVRLDLAVQAEPELRVVGERLVGADGVVLLETALRDPERRAVQAAWHTAGAAPVTRAPLPDVRLGTSLMPLRVAGKTEGQRKVLAAAEQMVVALRSVFACDPRPSRMRAPVPAGGGRLLRGCDNLADVLLRTHVECARRHAVLVASADAGCAGPVTGLRPELLDDGRVRALVDRGDGTSTPLGGLGDGELRYIALALVLCTGPGVLEVDPVGEVPAAMQTLTVLADAVDRRMDPRQRAELLRLASRMCDRGHIRLLATVNDPAWAEGIEGVTVVHLGT